MHDCSAKQATKNNIRQHAQKKKDAIKLFNGNVMVALPVPANYREAAARGKIKAYRYNPESKAWDAVGGDYDAATTSIVFETPHFSHYALLEMAPKKLETSPFTDIENHWAKDDIEWMYTHNYASGRSPSRFEPNAGITRAEFAALLVNVLQVEKPAEIPFTDVPQNAWYRDSVARAFGAKLISGTSAVQFQPQALITREQMAAMIANALRYKGVHVSSAATLESFQDRQTIAAWAVDSVRLVAGANIVTGKAGTNGPVFAPKDTATRAEAVVMLKRLLGELQGPQS